MVRFLQKSVVTRSAFYMIVAGILMGLTFLPFSHYMLGVENKTIYQFVYIATCIGSGVVVGITSFLVLRFTVLKELYNLSNKIESITDNILNYKKGTIENIDKCHDCYISLESDDILGNISKKYNYLIRLIRSLFWQHEREEEFSSILNRSLEMVELDKNAIDFISLITKSAAAQIYHIDKDKEILLGYAKGIKTTLTENKKYSLRSIIEEQKTVSLKDYQVELVEFGVCDIKPSEILYFPIRYNNMGVGLLVIYLTTYITSEKKSLIENLLSSYALAYQNAVSYERIQDIAALDELTGLYNRRFGMKRLTEEYERAKRTKSCLCAVMFDIDHFKKVNDTYGHQAGDYILLSFAKILQKNFRTEDVVMRYGGEEFLCILSNMDANLGYNKIDSIRKEVEQSVFNFNGSKIKITISAGVATLLHDNANNLTIDGLIKNADENLYKAKNSGRNRVVCDQHCREECAT